jgi:hypothetical protein
VLNVALAALYALTIVGSAVGEWGYFVLGSTAEAVLLVAVVYHGDLAGVGRLAVVLNKVGSSGPNPGRRGSSERTTADRHAVPGVRAALRGSAANIVTYNPAASDTPGTRTESAVESLVGAPSAACPTGTVQ